MSQDYEIAWVGSKTREWSSQKGGAMIDYTIALEDREGTVKLTQKSTTAAPNVGDTLHGHIDKEEVTPREGDPFTVHKFRKDQREDGPHRVHPDDFRKSKANNGSPPPAQDFDARGARIERMAAHKAAATLAATAPPAAQEAEFQKWLTLLSEDLDSYEKARGLKASGVVDEAEAAKVLEAEQPTPTPAGAGITDSDDIPF